MSEITGGPHAGGAAALLTRWLEGELPEAAFGWLRGAVDEISEGGPPRRCYISFSTAVHRCGKDELELGADDLAEAAEVCPGWNPTGWSREQAARALLLLALPAGDPVAWGAILTRVQETADVGEAVALGQALPLLPHPETHVLRAREILRTNITAAFESVACRNPWPARWLPEDAWNQMVLKAVFVGSRLHTIVGFGERANPDLSRMLADYAHERWSAGRPVDPELWRAVGPHADAEALEDLARVLSEGGEREREAAALGLASSPDPRAREILADSPGLAGAIAEGRLTWNDLIESETPS